MFMAMNTVRVFARQYISFEFKLKVFEAGSFIILFFDFFFSIIQFYRKHIIENVPVLCVTIYFIFFLTEKKDFIEIC